jgi:hypothetical protein
LRDINQGVLTRGIVPRSVVRPWNTGTAEDEYRRNPFAVMNVLYDTVAVLGGTKAAKGACQAPLV